ncbi:MAG: DUF4292 domain-containing protein [Bacteroidaceae bacterium]|nr:DUF4292 domain-containing protein [Bacteroidaceae bacterium]
MKRIGIMLVAAVAVSLAGCRSSRHAQKKKGVTPEETIMMEWNENGRVEKVEVVKRNTSVGSLQAKMDITLSRGSKSVHCTGTYRVKRGEMVQLNLVYSVLFVSVNVGTLELTPDYILLVDRVGKRYCRVGYDEVPQLSRHGLTYADIEPLFWGDKGDVKGSAVSCTFDEWADLAEGRFPDKISLTLRRSGKDVKASIALNNIKEGDAQSVFTDVSKKYQQVGLDVVMNAITSVAR